MRRKWLFLMLLALITGWSASVRAAQKRALTKNDLLRLVAGGVYNSRVAALLEDRGITFVPTTRDLESLRQAGADEALLHAVVTARHITAQVQERRRQPPLGRRVTPQAVPNPITPSPHRTLEVRPVISTLPRPETATPSHSQYMPFGMRELFEGHHFWRMPLDIEIVVGPTIPEKLPARYIEATEKYSRNVQVIHLPTGRNDILNYVGGEPFPHPEEPDKGYKLLADLWFAYVPHLLVGTSRNPLTICSQTSNGYFSCERLSYIFRQVAYNTDEETSAKELKGNNYWYTEWISVEEPEQLRYTTLLTLYPKDNQRPKELFTFIPSLRRWVRGSLTSRCSPVVGTDYVQDDFKRVGFNGGLGSFGAQFLEHRQILALTGDYPPLGADFPANYYIPIGWPRPSWGNWQLRDVDVIDIRRVPTERAGYCYGKRIIYQDSQTHYALWEDAYDAAMRLWKTAFLAQRMVSSPSVGNVPGAFTSTAWDFELHHMTNASTQSAGGDVLVDGEVPPEYRNDIAYSTPAGLAEIMK